MKFKTPSLSSEFELSLDPRVRAVALELDRFMLSNFKKPLFLTCVGRTLTQQAKANPLLPRGPHTDHPCRAVDIRHFDLLPSEKKALTANVKKWWPEMVWLEDDQGKQSPHFHLAAYQMERIEMKIKPKAA